MIIPQSIQKRFWAKVDTNPTPTGCWLWIGAKFACGYGQLRIQGKLRYAHRLAYELKYGSLLPGFEVCHRCDTPLCVNPAHLVLGTHADNMHDMVAKGRSTLNHEIGEAHYLAKLNPDKVRHMRSLYSQGLSFGKIARIYEVDSSTARNAILQQTWKHVD